jgi:hypothetical protein
MYRQAVKALHSGFNTSGSKAASENPLVKSHELNQYLIVNSAIKT